MSLLQMSFSGAILILVITMIRAAAIHRLPKKTFLILWSVAILRLLVPFSIPSMFSAYSLLNQSKPVQQVLSEMPEMPFLPATETETFEMEEMETEIQEPTKSAEKISPLFVIWLDGAVVCAVFFTVSYLRFRREFRFSLPVKNEFVMRWLRKHRLRRTIQIRQSDQITAPLTYGIFHPVILMPKKTDWENRKQISYVLLHEYVHICRFDTAIKLLLIGTLCIHWFNPFVWVMYTLFNRDLELACDESVVQRFGTESRKSYALTLIHMEETKGGLTPLCNNFSKNAIEERIRAIMKTRKRSMIAVFMGIVLIAVVSVLFATSAEKETDFAKNDVPEQSANTQPEEDLPENTDESIDDEAPVDEVQPVPEEPEEQLTTMTFWGEGLAEEVTVKRVAGEGYTICIPVEGWEMYAKDCWMAAGNEQVRLMVMSYMGQTTAQVEEMLQMEGYTRTEDGTVGILEQIVEDNSKMTAILSERDGNTWGVFYCHPATSEMEEGFGSRLKTMADTFVILEEQKLPLIQEVPEQKEPLAIPAGTEAPEGMSADAQEIYQVMKDFFAAYSWNNKDVLKTSLADSYDGELDVWEGDPKEISNVTYKGLVPDLEKQVGDSCTASVQFVASGEDSFTYLSLELVKENDGWKVQFYGLEK